MYLHIGEAAVIESKNIIGIFDMDTSTVNKATRNFLSAGEKNKKVVYVNYDLPKSFILTDEKIYVSPLNTATLLKRAKLNKKAADAKKVQTKNSL
ncbi:MAG: DUF370 domain-containing protein [Clostridiales bacterium]|nr:DUF370 domain-containing protein [Clostridiales bacterium]